MDKMVFDAAHLLGTKCGAVVEEVSIPLHSHGNLYRFPRLKNYTLVLGVFFSSTCTL